jgi:hypothetical protein
VAVREFYIGTVGPLFIDEDDPLFNNPGQLLQRQDGALGNIAEVDEFNVPTGKHFSLILVSGELKLKEL